MKITYFSFISLWLAIKKERGHLLGGGRLLGRIRYLKLKRHANPHSLTHVHQFKMEHVGLAEWIHKGYRFQWQEVACQCLFRMKRQSSSSAWLGSPWSQLLYSDSFILFPLIHFHSPSTFLSEAPNQNFLSGNLLFTNLFSFSLFKMANWPSRDRHKMRASRQCISAWNNVNWRPLASRWVSCLMLTVMKGMRRNFTDYQF